MLLDLILGAFQGGKHHEPSKPDNVVEDDDSDTGSCGDDNDLYHDAEKGVRPRESLTREDDAERDQVEKNIANIVGEFEGDNKDNDEGASIVVVATSTNPELGKDLGRASPVMVAVATPHESSDDEQEDANIGINNTNNTSCTTGTPEATADDHPPTHPNFDKPPQPPQNGSDEVASAVATDITTPATEPSDPPTPASQKSPCRLEHITVPNNQDDIPEDLPVLIRTQQRKPKPRAKSLAPRRAPTLDAATAQSTTTALASNIGLKHEAIVQSLVQIFQQLETHNNNSTNNEETLTGGNTNAASSLHKQWNQAIADQRVLIGELQEVISRLETDARREEAENVRLKRRLQRHGQRSTTTTTTPSLRSSKKSLARATRHVRGNGGGGSSVFPVAEIICTTTPLTLEEEDDLTFVAEPRVEYEC